MVMSSAPGAPLSRGRALLYGGLTVGILDITNAFVFFGLRGGRPTRILQGIASGLLGRASFDGGAATVALGAAIHFFIAFCVAGTYLALSRHVRVLAQRPLVCGPVYGLAVYAVMNLVVIPLSAIHRGPMTLPVLANGLLIHLLGVGLPSALAARAAAPAA